MARTKQVTMGQVGRGRRAWIWDIKCATTFNCWDAIEEREVKDNSRVKWTKEPQVEISSGGEGIGLGVSVKQPVG